MSTVCDPRCGGECVTAPPNWELHDGMRTGDDGKHYCTQACREAMRPLRRPIEEMDERIKAALRLAQGYGGIDGGHHKMWTIDQMVRALCGTEEAYAAWVKGHNAGADGPDTYAWDTGIAP